MEQFVSRIFSVHQIAAAIKDARIARGWTQEDLATQTGFSRVWINRFEQSVISDPSFRRILTMCDVLNIDMSAAYAPGRQTPPTGRRIKRYVKGDTPKTDERNSQTIRPQTVMNAAAILEDLAGRANSDTGTRSGVNES